MDLHLDLELGIVWGYWWNVVIEVDSNGEAYVSTTEMLVLFPIEIFFLMLLC